MSSLASRRRRLVLVAVLLVVALGAFGLWFRTSSFVRVDAVTVAGVAGVQATQIRDALSTAARGMSTLKVNDGALRDAVSTYPVVRSLHTSTNFPHGLRIVVNAYDAVAALQRGSALVAVASDGTILRGSRAAGLPLVAIKTVPGADRVENPNVLAAITVVAAAPPPLRKRVERVYEGARGLTATIDGGPKLYFGGGERIRAKWLSAAEVLAHAGTQGASYVDLRIPEKPVAGGFQPLPAGASGST
ncbi:MAG TPA: cell division protein FtsQ/DivIB [Solirubrobacteraceae bacterium]